MTTKYKKALVAAALTLFFAIAGRSATYLECNSKDIKTCTKEVTKGEAIKGILLNNGKKYLKAEFQTVNEKKGTLVKDAE